MTEDMRSRRQRMRDRARAHPEDVPHGTISGYDLWGCRCDECARRQADRAKAWRKSESGSASNNQSSTRSQQRSQQGTSPARRWQPWTGVELAYLAENRDAQTTAEMALQLGRTFYATAQALHRLDEGGK